MAWESFDVSDAIYRWNVDMSGYDSFLGAPRFSPDGLNMYLIDYNFDKIRQFKLPVPWDVRNPYFYASLSTSSNSNNPIGLAFNGDGTLMFFIDEEGSFPALEKWTLSTGWDLKTLSGTSEESLGITSTELVDLSFSSDGSYFFTIKDGRDLLTYSLSTPWDHTTLAYDGSRALEDDVGGTDEYRSNGFWFNDDGTKLYVSGSQTDSIRSYSLSTAWTGALTYDNDYYITSGDFSAPYGVSFNNTGTKMYVQSEDYIINQYTTAFASYTSDVSDDPISIDDSIETNTGFLAAISDSISINETIEMIIYVLVNKFVDVLDTISTISVLGATRIEALLRSTKIMFKKVVKPLLGVKTDKSKPRIMKDR